ncbi:MAG: Aerobic respiration control sensor protein ArcB, partial [Verrucomicrobiota bacterium]
MKTMKPSEELAVWQSSLDAIITMDELGNITDFNPAAEKMFGYSAADVVGQ